MKAASDHPREEGILSYVEDLFGVDSEAYRKVDAIQKAHRDDLARIRESERFGESVVAILGKPDVGKTTLLKTIFPDSEEVQALPSGDGCHTKRLEWVSGVGTDPASSENMISIERSASPFNPHAITFVDTPAFGSPNEGVRGEIREVLLLADIKLVIAGSDDLSLEQLLTELKDADGSVIIPVIRLTPGSTIAWADESKQQEIRRDVDDTMRRWRNSLPSVDLRDAVFLGDLDSKSAWDSVETIRSKIVGAIELALDEPTRIALSKENRIKVAENRFCEHVRADLNPFIEHIKGSYEKVRQAHQTLPSEAINHIFSEHDSLTSYLKWQIRRRILGDLNSLLIPVRSLWTMVAYTSGAWERLMLGMQGSFLSLVLAGKKSLGNLSEVVSGEARFGTRLKEELNTHLRARIAPAFNEFSRDVEGIGSVGENLNDPGIQVEVTGLESLVAKWTNEVESATCASSSLYSRIGGFLGFGVFWYLISGPFVYLYSRQIPAVLEAWRGEWSGSPQLHPFASFSAGEWITSLLIAVVPVLLLGAVVFATACRRRRVRTILKRIKDSLTKSYKSGEITLEVDLKSRKIEAARRLMMALDRHHP